MIGLGVLGAVMVLGLIATLSYPLVVGEEPAAVTPSSSSSETPSQPAPLPLGANSAAEDSENTPVVQSEPPPPPSSPSPLPSSPSPSSEEELRAFAEDYYDAVALEDWEYLYALQDSLTQQKYTEDEYVQRNQYFAELDSLIETSTSISSEVSTSSPVEVTLTQTFESGATSSRITYFVWEDGSWKHRFSEEDDAIFLPDASYEEFVAANGGGSSEEASPSDYTLVADPSGSLTMEVPSTWETLTGDASETIEPTWSSFADESIVSSISASPDLGAMADTLGVTGAYMVASRSLAQDYTVDELVTAGPNDFSDNNCGTGLLENYERGIYSGRTQSWTSCGDGGAALTLAVTPEGGDCVILLLVVLAGEASEDDLVAAGHILDTFEADCAGIAATGGEQEDRSIEFAGVSGSAPPG